MAEVVYKPRGDYVVVQIIEIGKMAGGTLFAPQSSVHGKRFVVHAVGPDVFGLKPGDVVMPSGKRGTDYFEIPNSPSFILMKQENVPLVLEEKS